jgi:probable phosphoglycerate mutase
MKCIESLANHPAHHRIALVTHGGVLDTVYRRATGMGFDLPRNFDVLNASINRVMWDGSNFAIVKWADVSHLAHAALDEIDHPQ